MKSKNFKSVIAVLPILILFVLLGLACSDSNEPQIQAKLNEKIATEKFEVTVTSVKSKTKVGTDFIEEVAPEGAVFVIIDFNYKNITDQPINSFSLPDIKIIDPNNAAYDEAIGASASYSTQMKLETKIASDLNPGIGQKDAAVFEVSKDIWAQKGWKMIIKADKNIEILIP